jgi:hypothetical protein
MLKFTSVSGSVRAITDITLTGTIIRTRITRDLIIDPITGRTTGTEGIVIIAIIIVTPIITGTNVTGIATPGWLETFRASLIFRADNLLRDPTARDRRSYLPEFAEGAGLAPLPGSSSWNSFLNC